jgi:hypothetical protein
MKIFFNDINTLTVNQNGFTLKLDNEAMNELQFIGQYSINIDRDLDSENGCAIIEILPC